MAAIEHPLYELARFLPAGSFDYVVKYLYQYKVHLTVAKSRKSVLGDYRHAHQGNNHRISVNGNLNSYEFLITLLHELAHLLTFEQYQNRVEPHGKEWKSIYSKLLIDFVGFGVFPTEIVSALQKSIISPAATANGETELLMVLRKYNTSKKEGVCFIADLPEGALFRLSNGKVFKKGELRRKRYTCIELKTGLMYTVSAITEVKQLEVIHP
ncbi:SprT-like domain-containing protein [Sediminibacterium sp.]|uniref:SprT-like domain-containing protein n=1 Tax=Sediminibacterium sp. TaxID=1917865 RepID=UPI002731766F|nr:SprT-like domain-containing protein [Sediminibacterium sp.]MDP2421122.1 SprT-like domain-containing protein [Sediminibacterium sp.]